MSEARQEKGKPDLTKAFVDEYNEMDKENHALKAELHALKDAKQTVTVPAELVGELERLKTDLEARQEALAACTAAAADLRKEHDDLQSKNDTLTTEGDRLGRECNTLRRQNRELSTRVDVLQKKCEEWGPLIDPDLSGKLEEYKLRYQKALEELEGAKEEQHRIRRQLFDCQKRLGGG
jgi:chromosome segregation ATPase